MNTPAVTCCVLRTQVSFFKSAKFLECLKIPYSTKCPLQISLIKPQGGQMKQKSCLKFNFRNEPFDLKIPSALSKGFSMKIWLSFLVPRNGTLAKLNTCVTDLSQMTIIVQIRRDGFSIKLLDKIQDAQLNLYFR